MNYILQQLKHQMLSVLMVFHLQFCEWISTPLMCERAGPVLDLLLEHVGQVQLCSKLTELLDSREKWHDVKRKLCES